jgi:hypothetical protein
MDPEPAQPRRRRHRGAPRERSTGRTRRIFLLACVALVLLAGAAMTWKVVEKMRARPHPEFTRLLNESNQAVSEANQLAVDATPLFHNMVREVDEMGVEKFRAERADTAAKVGEMFRQAIEKFHLGETKLQESIGRNKDAQLTPYLEMKVRSYGLYAQTLEANQEIVRMLMDNSIPTADELLPKVLALASRRDELDRQARQTRDEANEMARQLQGGGK